MYIYLIPLVSPVNSAKRLKVFLSTEFYKHVFMYSTIKIYTFIEHIRNRKVQNVLFLIKSTQ